MDSAHVLEALASLIVTSLVGRVVLSVLPPGRPGRHDLASLPATWGASYLLGAIALTAEVATLEALSVDLGDWGVLIPWALLALVRWITLPGAMEPRHEIRSEVPDAVARIVALVALLLGAWAGLRVAGPWHGTRVLPAAAVVAVLIACGESLACARRAPLARSLAMLALALLLVATPPNRVPLELLLVGSGAAFAIPWLRRADRRACALSVLSFAGAGLGGRIAAGFAFAGLLGLCLRTPKPVRARLAAWSLAAFLAFGALGTSAHAEEPILGPRWAVWLDAAVLVAALGVATAWTFRRPRATSASSAAIEEPRREIAALRDMLLVGTLLVLLLGASDAPDSGVGASLPLIPLAVLLAALVLAPAEKPLANA